MSPGNELSVSVNGVDNVGKTTQLAWLRRGIPSAHLVGTIDTWDSRWQQVAADFAHWWFAGSTTAEHVGLVLGSHAARRAGSGHLALEDRGLPMLRATCAATAAVKDGLAPCEALRLVDRLIAELPAANERGEVHLLLRRSDDPWREADEALRRESGPPSERYASYQRALAAILSLQVERGEYDAVLDIGDAPILDVQRRLRTSLAGFGVDARPLPDATVERLWVLAGMSESGKSTVGGLLRDEHGVTRLKIGYLLDIAALRAGVPDPYERWSEPEQAERLTEEILRFAWVSKAHLISVESAHRFEATAHLRRIWGERCQVTYIAADTAARTSRAAETEARLRARDEVKRERGAHRIAGIADHTINNTGPLSVLKLMVDRLVSTVDVPRATAIDPMTGNGWLARATEHIVDEQVALVLATGSTGTAAWRAGWSDVDLLVVRDCAPAGWLRRVVGTLPAPAGIKTGVSTFTTGDIGALRVPPRVVQTLRRAATGVGVLYRRPGYGVPVPSVAHGDRTSRGELGLVLMTTRRLLGGSKPDVRALHKHLVLLAKILLRADGCDIHDADAVLAAFRDRHPAAGCAPPSLDDLIRTPTDPNLARQLINATGRLLDYLDRIGRTSP